MFPLNYMNLVVLILLTTYLAVVAVRTHQFEAFYVSFISIIGNLLALSLYFFLELVS